MTNTDQALPTFAELAQAKIDAAGERDRNIQIKISLPTARMMVISEQSARSAEDLMRAGYDEAVSRSNATEVVAARLQSRSQDLEQALAPFAHDVPRAIEDTASFVFWTGYQGDKHKGASCTAADVRRAHALLQGSREQPRGDLANDKAQLIVALRAITQDAKATYDALTRGPVEISIGQFGRLDRALELLRKLEGS